MNIIKKGIPKPNFCSLMTLVEKIIPVIIIPNMIKPKIVRIIPDCIK